MEKPSGVPAEIARQTEETLEAFRRDHRELPAFRADVLWADADDVVTDAVAYLNDREADDDPQADRERPRTNHRTVCKPTPGYQKPLEFVKEGIRR